MKKVLIIALALVTAGLVYAFMPKNNSSNKKDGAATAQAKHVEGAINWLTWDEAIKANEAAPKKIFIDFYTNWCGWCKRMDQTTFSDPAIAQYINQNFYAVKFNAEQKEDVLFNGTTFSWKAGGRNGYHQLAFDLLNGRMGYPSYVYLTPTHERILISPGYKSVEDLQKELKFVAEDHYASSNWEEYKRKN